MKKSFLNFLLLLVVLLSFGSCTTKEEKKKKKVRTIPIRVSKVQVTNLKESLKFTGDIEGKAQVQLFASVADRILSIKVRVGEKVKKGQTLAVVEHARLRQAEMQARSQLAGVQTQKAGAVAKLAGAKVSLSSNLREYRRIKNLLKRGAIGKQQVDLAWTRYEASKTQVRAASIQIRALDAQIKALQAGVAQARTIRRKATLRAPFAGIIGRVYRQEGDMILPQLPLIQLVSMDTVKVKINVAEKNLREVRLGRQAEVRVAAWANRVFVGKITKVAPTLDLDTRSAPVEIEIQNIHPTKQTCKKDKDCSSALTCIQGFCAEKHPLKPGMIAKVNVLVKTHTSAITIPLHAIINNSFGYDAIKDSRQLAVYTLQGKDLVRKEIRIGIPTGSGFVQVKSGLQPQDKVVTSGQNLYKKGDKIQIIEANKGSQK